MRHILLSLPKVKFPWLHVHLLLIADGALLEPPFRYMWWFLPRLPSFYIRIFGFSISYILELFPDLFSLVRARKTSFCLLLLSTP